MPAGLTCSAAQDALGRRRGAALLLHGRYRVLSQAAGALLKAPRHGAAVILVGRGRRVLLLLGAGWVLGCATPLGNPCSRRLIMDLIVV